MELPPFNTAGPGRPAHRRADRHRQVRRIDRPVDEPVIVIDTVLDEITAQVAAWPPERGGALCGVQHDAPPRTVIAEFLFDHAATTTTHSYQPSLTSSHGDASLEASVQLVETASRLRFCGYVHSHPAGLDRPSNQDLVAFADTFRLNPHLASLEVPIVTPGPTGPPAEHQVPLPSGRLSWYVVLPTDETTLVCRPRPVAVSPIGTDLLVAIDQLGAQLEVPAWQPWTLDDTWWEAVVTLPDGAQVAVRVDVGRYPQAVPVARRRGVSGPSGPLVDHPENRWDPDGDRSDALAELIATAARPHKPSTSRTGACRADQLDEVGEPGRLDELGERFRARLDGIVPASIRSASVAVFGLGSGGSQIAEALARAGIERFWLIDPDRVEVENLSRSVYCFDDVGHPKCDALARHLSSINPSITIEALPHRVQALSGTQLRSLTAAASLVVGATDDPAAQARLNAFAYPAGTPAVYGGVYALGRGGEAILAVPGVTPCYRCATAFRRRSEHTSFGDHDYGLDPGRLDGAPALGADIGHVALAVAKLGLALLATTEPTSSLVDEFLVPSIVHRGHAVASFVQFSMVPDFDYFPQVFFGVAGQGAWQTVWLVTEPDPDCPFCATADTVDAAHVGDISRAAATITLDEINTARNHRHLDPTDSTR